ncbi:MAG: hypothetical protein JWO38_5705 [Gemmataceae bacterium]|nr:hypothetical protein [Gemmataceae bacterium]
MNRMGIGICVVALYFLLPSTASAQTNTWTATYPKKGAMAGSVLVDGTFTPTAGWRITGGGLVSYWPTAGGVVTITVDTTTGKWSGMFLATAGTNYTVTVQCTQKSGMTPQNVATPAATITP